MQQLAQDNELEMLCALVELPRSSYYYPAHPRDREELKKAIQRLCLKHSRYGYRRIHQHLQREHFDVGREQVRLLMKEMHLQVRPRRRKYATNSDPDKAPYPNLLKGLDIVRSDHVWCADITSIPLVDGSHLYLAILMDIFTRMVRGWSLRRDYSETLVQEALAKALQTGHVPEIHHSDQGSQYGATNYCRRLESLGSQLSMAGRGRAWENPYAESAIGHLKDEEVWQQEYASFKDASWHLSHFLDVFYNSERIHSSLGYLTPAEFEEQRQR